MWLPKQRISTSWGVCRLLGYSRRAPSAALRLLTVACAWIASPQTFASHLSLKLSVLPLHADLPWKVLVVSNHALLKSFLQRKKQSLPNVRLHRGSSMDPEVLTANGQPFVPCHTTKPAGCRSLRARRQFSVDSQLPAQATGETHVGHFHPSWKRKPFLIFVFRIWSRRMFIWSQWCAWSLGFRRKVATAPSFLVAKLRVPVAKCDYAPGFFEPWLFEKGNTQFE